MLIGLCLGLFFSMTSERNRPVTGSEFVVYEEKNVLFRGDFDVDTVIVFNAREGRMKVAISKGEVRVVESHCRHKICQHQRVTNKGGEIVCVPQKISIKSQEEIEVDFVVQ